MAFSVVFFLSLVISAPADEAPAEAADDDIALLIAALDHQDAAIRDRAVAAF